MFNPDYLKSLNFDDVRGLDDDVRWQIYGEIIRLWSHSKRPRHGSLWKRITSQELHKKRPIDDARFID